MRRNYNPSSDIALFTPEERARAAWNAYPNGEGFYMVDGYGAQFRNQSALTSAQTVTIEADQPTGTVYSADLTLNPDNNLAQTLMLLLYNGSDADLTVTLSNVILVDAEEMSLPIANAVYTVKASSGVAAPVSGLGWGDLSPAVGIVLTSASTTGGTVTMDLRYM